MSYYRKLFSTGAIRETPANVIQALLREIDTKSVINVVEFGAGRGEITHALLKKPGVHIDSFYAFELDKQLGVSLKSATERVTVLYEDAFAFEEFISDDEPIDYFICALPLSFFPKAHVQAFFSKQQARLRKGGKILVIFHAFWMVRLLDKLFPSGKLRVLLTFPPYFFFRYTKD